MKNLPPYFTSIVAALASYSSIYPSFEVNATIF